MVQSQNSKILADASLVFILFILIFFAVIILISLLREAKNIIKSSKLYYGVLLILLITKIFAYLIYVIKLLKRLKNPNTQISDQDIAQFSIVYKNLFFLTDLVFILELIIVCQKYSVLYFNSVINNTQKSISKFVIFVYYFLFVALASIIVAFNINSSHFSKFLYVYASGNFASIFCLFFIQFYLNIKLAGTLVQRQTEDLLKHFKHMQLYYFISRAGSGVYSILIASLIQQDDRKLPYFNFILGFKYIESLLPFTTISCAFIYFCFEFVTSGIPMILSVNHKTINALSNIKINDMKQSLLSENPSLIITQQTTGQQFQKISLVQSFNQGQIINKKIKKQGLGIVKKCRYRSKFYAIRQIELELSKYLIQEIQNEISDKHRLDISALLNVDSCEIISNNKIYFISDYIINLFDYMNTEVFSLNEKVKIALQIAQSIFQLHKQNLPHGSLKFNNIFIQKQKKNYIVKLGDHGFLPLKKFSCLTLGYSNKTVFTAPEFLGDRSNVLSKPTKEGDVYAFGLIMYELFTSNYNYNDLTLKQIQKTFKQNKTRPKIPDMIPNNLINLIRSCWQQQSDKRPTIQQVRTFLRQYCKE